jgi:hypothetical protein
VFVEFDVVDASSCETLYHHENYLYKCLTAKQTIILSVVVVKNTELSKSAVNKCIVQLQY